MLLKSIDIVFREKHKILENEKNFKAFGKTLEVISSYFQISHREALVFSIAFIMSLRDTTFSLTNLSELFLESTTDILVYREELEALCEKGIVRKYYNSMSDSLFVVRYSVNSKGALNILNNKPLGTKAEKEPDIYTLLMKIHKMILNREDFYGKTEVLTKEVTEILLVNQEHPIVKEILSLKLRNDYNLIYLYLLWSSLDGSLENDVGFILSFIYNNAAAKVRVMQSLIDGSNELIKMDLVETCEGLFGSEIQLKLTETSIDLVKKHGITLAKGKNKLRIVIKPSAIDIKNLIFKETEVKQLTSLKELLKKDSLETLTRNLKELNMPDGVTALFYGGSGTGKTESVLQMARETNREILKVDISCAKSMWYGESEKMVKKIFAEYRSFLKECDRVPIQNPLPRARLRDKGKDMAEQDSFSKLHRISTARLKIQPLRQSHRKYCHQAYH